MQQTAEDIHILRRGDLDVAPVAVDQMHRPAQRGHNGAGVHHIVIPLRAEPNGVVGGDDVPEPEGLGGLGGIGLFAQGHLRHTAAVGAEHHRLIAGRAGNGAAVLFYGEDILCNDVCVHIGPHAVVEQDHRVGGIFRLRLFQHVVNGVLSRLAPGNDARSLGDVVFLNKGADIVDIFLQHRDIDLVDHGVVLKQLQGVDKYRLAVDLQKLLGDAGAHAHAAAAGEDHCNIHAFLLPFRSFCQVRMAS